MTEQTINRLAVKARDGDHKALDAIVAEAKTLLRALTWIEYHIDQGLTIPVQGSHPAPHPRGGIALVARALSEAR